MIIPKNYLSEEFMLEGFDKIEQVKPAGRASLLIGSGVSISAAAAIGGIKEGAGSYGSCFDYIDKDDRFGQDSFEGAESAMQGLALQTVLEKRGVSGKDISVLFGGDLLNQCIGTSFGTADFDIPFVGIYGACSTMAEGLMLAAAAVGARAAKSACAITSSHFCTAERQYRLPLDYGGQRTPTSQWTATAAGALIVERQSSPPYVKAVTAGRITDAGIKDANNMGAAMAPAAYSTIAQFFADTHADPNIFDAIVTGDLGLVGSKILHGMLRGENLCGMGGMGEAGIRAAQVHTDCGCMIFSKEQDVHAGGSGCGCAASMLCGHFVPLLRSKKLKNILFAATGALLSTTSSQQGRSIPSISHLVWLTSEEN